MKVFLIIIAIWLGILSCTSNQQTAKRENKKIETEYLFKNPCWGFSNLEKLYLKWNWVKLEDSNKQIKTPLNLEFRIIRFNKFKEIVFDQIIYKTRKTNVPLNKKYFLYSAFYTNEIYVKNIKKLLILDKPFFENNELNDYTLEEWEERDELGDLYGSSEKGSWRESFMVTKNSKKGCSSSFFKKSPHLIKISLFDKDQKEVISTMVPLNKIQRSPPYFDKWELPKLGLVFKGELYPISVGVSLVLENFNY